MSDAPQLTSAQLELFQRLLASRETVFRVCLGFCRDAGEAEDLAHDAYLAAYRKLSTLKNREAPRGWLLRIARNICLNHIRRPSRQPLLSIDQCDPAAAAATPEQSLELREQLAILKSVIASLPRRMKDVFVLREYGRLPYEEIAAALGLRRGTVMSRLNRARQRVTQKMRSINHE